MFANQSAESSATAPPRSSDPASAGKATPSSQLPAGTQGAATASSATPVSGSLPAPLASHVNETFVDGGHYVWRINADGSFACVAQPAGVARSSVGAKVTSAKSPDLWQKLCAMAIQALAPTAVPATPSAPTAGAPAAAPAPAPASSGFSLDGFLAMLVAAGSALFDIGSLVADLVESVGAAGPPAAQPAPTPGAPGAAPAPAAPAPAPAPAAPAPKPAPSPAAPAPAPAAPAAPGPAPAPAPAKGPSSAPAAPTPEPEPEAGGGGAAAATGDVQFCTSNDARLRDENGTELVPKQKVPVSSYVRILERRTSPKALVRVAYLDSSTSTGGTELGWSSESNFRPLVRPHRPSDPAAQMAAVLATAKSAHGVSNGSCYHMVKEYIRDAGGYGDILDIFNDERLTPGFHIPATDFARAVDTYGAEALGLQRVSGLPMDAPPGTLVVTRGNGKPGLKLSVEYGDIAVKSHVEGGVVVLYNDGTIKFETKPEMWSSGLYEGILVGMFQPIARK